MRARGIIFDWGNTLVDVHLDWDTIRARRLEVLAEHLRTSWGLADADALVEEFVRVRVAFRERSVREVYEHDALSALREALARRRVEEPPDGGLQRALDVFFGPEVPLIRPFHDAVATLEELRRRGLRLGLVSNNTWAAPVVRTLETGGLSHLLDPQAHSSQLRFRKPDPMMLLHVLRRWGLGPSEVVVVGDKRDRDILAARRLGMRSVWARMRPEREVTPECEAVEADAEVRTLSELLDLIRWG